MAAEAAKLQKDWCKNMSYGLPFEFKAIKTDTGEEKRLDPNWMYGFKVNGVKIVQQTGYTAGGSDVYFGDVLAYSDNGNLSMCLVQFRPHLGIVGYFNYSDEYLEPNDFEGWRIVGNIYEPPARWLERAREIWPDAQLPQEVKGV